MKTFKIILLYVAVILFVIFFVITCYRVAKTVSYKMFYRDMVRNEIHQMVRPESLRQEINHD